MNVVFIWVKEYKKLEDFQTSFSGKYKIKYTGKKLVITKNNNYVKNFFKINGSNININLSLIVGENGTGKSTILDMLLEYIQQGKFLNDYIIVFEYKGQIYIDSNFEIKKVDLPDSDIQYEMIKDESLEKFFRNQVTIFFSNVFDVRYFEYTDKIEGHENKRVNYAPQVKNISTNALLANYKEPKDFLNQDFSKQIFFVNEYKSILEVEELVSIPEKIYLKTNPVEPYFEELSHELEEFISAFTKENVSSLYFNFETDNKFKKKMIVILTQRFCVDIGFLLNRFNLDDAFLLDAYNNASKDEGFFEIINNNLVREIKKFYNEDELPHSVKKTVNETYIRYQQLLKYIFKLNFKNDEIGFFIDSNTPLVNSFINFYKDNFYYKDILNFFWSEMSSGQLSLLNLFGRFYDSLNEIKFDLLEENEVSEEMSQSMGGFEYLLLIDECDLYFHPQWQKDWLYYFLKLIEILFKGNIQVILTTHSPFILSDFPNTNVTFLEGQSKTLTINNEIEGSPRTFGANISELFTNSFFINDALMGKFAKNKINNFIKRLMNTSPDEVLKNKNEIRTFIDIIGEPLIKNKLLQIYNEKLQLASDDDIEKRIMNLGKELSILKRRSELN